MNFAQCSSWLETIEHQGLIFFSAIIQEITAGVQSSSNDSMLYIYPKHVQTSKWTAASEVE